MDVRLAKPTKGSDESRETEEPEEDPQPKIERKARECLEANPNTTIMYLSMESLVVLSRVHHKALSQYHPFKMYTQKTAMKKEKRNNLI